MIEYFPFFLSLIVVIVLLIMLAAKTKVAFGEQKSNPEPEEDISEETKRIYLDILEQQRL